MDNSIVNSDIGTRKVGRTHLARRRITRTAVAGSITVAVLAAGVPAAQAVHWPVFGGDNGHSGYQPVDEGAVPLRTIYAKTSAADQFVKTSIVTSTGSPGTQRLVFGTRDGFVNFQILETYVPVGPEAGTDIDEGTADLDVFGTRGTLDVPGGNGASVSFADASGPTGLGQLYAVHNDDDVTAGGADIEIAQFDETTGLRVRADVDVAGTDGFTVDSSLNFTAPSPVDGSRVLFFVARRDADASDARLFRVPITGAAATAAAVVNGAAATNSGDIDATPLASPTIVFLDTPTATATATATAHVVVGTAGGVRSFRTTDLGIAGPSFTGPAGRVFQTPSVPVQPSGNTPQPGGPVTTAPFIYVAAASGGDTEVYKLRPSPGGGPLVAATAARAIPGSGLPAPALAVTQVAEPTQTEGKIIVTTANNLYVLNTADLSPAGQLSATALVPGTTGFRQTTAAASGGFGYVTRDNSEQVVFRISDGQQVPAAQFTQAAGNPALPGTGVGQPSISRGFVQFAGGNGVFVYRNVDRTPPTIVLTSPADSSTATGTVTLSANAADARGITKVDFFIDGRRVGTATTPTSGSPFAATGAIYSINVATSTLVNGLRTVTAVATDTSGLTTTSAARRFTVTGSSAVAPRPRPDNTDTSPRPAPGCRAGSITVDRPTIVAGGLVKVTGTATPNSRVELLAATRPSSSYRVVRRTLVSANGSVAFAVVPPANTRLALRQVGCAQGVAIGISVRTTLSLTITRSGGGHRFVGRIVPARPGGQVVSLYRVSGGRQVLVGLTRARGDGVYTLVRRAPARTRYVVRTGSDGQNAAGSSAVKSLRR